MLCSRPPDLLLSAPCRSFQRQHAVPGAAAGRGPGGSVCRSVGVAGGGDRRHPGQPVSGCDLPGAALRADQPGRTGGLHHRAGSVLQTLATVKQWRNHLHVCMLRGRWCLHRCYCDELCC